MPEAFRHPENVRRIRPTPSDEYLANPHKGCCTFQHFNGDALFPGLGWSEEGPLAFPPPKVAGVISGYLPTTVAYCRWFWAVLEPTQGAYDFSMIDKSLAVCAARGQTLAVRLMAFGSARQPQVPAWYAKQYPMEEYDVESNDEQRIPIHDSAEYLEHWGNLIRAFGAKYDGHPLLESIDVTFIGPWGEGAGECCREQVERFAQVWQDAFPQTPRLALVEGDQLPVNIQAGSGWRCDCFGDLKTPGSAYVEKQLSWNHMFEAYPREIYEGGATDAWKTAPVHFESCGVPMHWYKGGYDIDFIIAQGLKYHGTYFMPKSARLPEAWLDKLAGFCRRLGYRYVFRQAIISREAQSGGAFRFIAWIENVGVAPIYHRYDFAVRIRQDGREEIIVLDDIDIRTWLPGDVWLNRELQLPDWLRPGWAEVAVGLVRPGTSDAAISFAVQERYADRWTPLAGIEIR